MKVLVTGAAGFIGYWTSKVLCDAGHEVLGIDNLNDYYDVSLKRARLKVLESFKNFNFQKLDIAHREPMNQLFLDGKFDKVIHLAAQAGVRYSVENPHAYIDSNIVGFMNVLEGCRHHQVKHLIYASTSSVYGISERLPFSPHDDADHPISLYGATKRANELMAHSYSYLYQLPTTGLRFFTVYGPWGRPDMALFIFTKKILAGEPIEIFNNGNHARDFTYVEDIVDGIRRVAEGQAPASLSPEWNPKNPDPSLSAAPFRIYNIGANSKEPLMKYVELIEKYLEKTAQKIMMPLQLGDTPESLADISDLQKDFNYQAKTDIAKGVRLFIDWYLEYSK